MKEFAGMKMVEVEGQAYALYTDIKGVEIDSEQVYRFYFGDEPGGKAGLARAVKVSDRSRDGRLCSCTALVFIRPAGKDWQVSGETSLLDAVDPETGAEGYEAWDLAAGRSVFVSEVDFGRLWDYSRAS